MINSMRVGLCQTESATRFRRPGPVGVGMTTLTRSSDITASLRQSLMPGWGPGWDWEILQRNIPRQRQQLSEILSGAVPALRPAEKPMLTSIDDTPLPK